MPAGVFRDSPLYPRARQIMAKRGQDVLLEARTIAKRLAFLPDQPIQAGMEIRDTFAHVDMLGPQLATQTIPAVGLG